MGDGGRLPVDPQIRLQLFLDDSVEFVRRLGPLEIRRLLVSLSRVGGLTLDETEALRFGRELSRYESRLRLWEESAEQFRLAKEYISIREAGNARL